MKKVNRALTGIAALLLLASSPGCTTVPSSTTSAQEEISSLEQQYKFVMSVDEFNKRYKTMSEIRKIEGLHGDDIAVSVPNVRCYCADVFRIVDGKVMVIKSQSHNFSENSISLPDLEAYVKSIAKDFRE